MSYQIKPSLLYYSMHWICTDYEWSNPALLRSVSLWLRDGTGLMEESPSSGDDDIKDVLRTDDIADSYSILWDLTLGEGLSGFVRFLALTHIDHAICYVVMVTMFN